MRQFNTWHSMNAQAIDTATCDEREMDKALSRYLQYLFENNGSRSSAADALCAAQHFVPRLKGHLPISWRALRAWTNFSPGQCRKPWPPQLVLALIALARLLNEEAVALCLALMFHCLLRPKEATNLRTKHFNVGEDMQWLSRQVGVVTLIEPKTRRTGPRVQHVTIENSCLLNDLRAFLATRQPEEIVFPSYAALDRLTKAWLAKLLGAGHGLTLGGLRAGGATYFFLETENVPWVQRRGRWSSARSLDHYVQQATAVLTSASWAAESRAKVDTLARQSPPYLART